MAPRDMPDGDFAVCRIMYRQVRTEPSGAGWRTDYPTAETNLMIRFSELTKTRVSVSRARRPNHWVVRLTDDALFNCPFTRSEEHTSELQSRLHLVCRLLLEKKKRAEDNQQRSDSRLT